MKLTIAETIKAECKNSSDAMDHAAELEADADQDWNNETATFTFEDGSKLAASGPEFWVVK